MYSPKNHESTVITTAKKAMSNIVFRLFSSIWLYMFSPKKARLRACKHAFFTALKLHFDVGPFSLLGLEEFPSAKSEHAGNYAVGHHLRPVVVIEYHVVVELPCV